MEVWVVIERMSQSEYTEPRYWSSASDSGNVCSVHDSYEKAEAEKVRLEVLDAKSQEEFETDPCYYEVECHLVQ